jgi:hypothetical protein
LSTRPLSEEERLLQEIQWARDHPPTQQGKPVDALRRLVEADPPTHHSYQALSAIISILMVGGTMLISLGALGFCGALAGLDAATSIESGGPPTIAFILRFAGGILAAFVALAGFMMIVSGQWLKLFIDLQQNSDRQSFALHALFQLALADRHKEPDHEQVT